MGNGRLAREELPGRGLPDGANGLATIAARPVSIGAPDVDTSCSAP